MSRTFTKAEKADRAAAALARLKATTKPGDRFYTILTHRAASGMSRRLKVVRAAENSLNPAALAGIVVPGLKIENVTWDVAHALGLRINLDTHEITMTGCGFDAGFEVVYQLGRKLWPEGTPEPHSTRNGESDRDGGYALKHEWL